MTNMFVVETIKKVKGQEVCTEDLYTSEFIQELLNKGYKMFKDKYNKTETRYYMEKERSRTRYIVYPM